MQASPLFTIVLAVTDETAHLLPFTLESIFTQDFPAFEVLVIDGQKREHSVDIFYTHTFPPTRVVDAKEEGLFAMMNQGLSIAAGEYVHFLEPGEFYISRHALTFVAEFIQAHALPDLVYTGSIIHHSLSPPEILMKQMSEEELKNGRVAKSVQSYWFRQNAIKNLKGFNPFYKVRGGFDLLCRFFHHPSLKRAFLKRVLTDYTYLKPPAKKICSYFWETLLILLTHFGVSAALFWWLAQSQLRLLVWSVKCIKGAFWKRGIST